MDSLNRREFLATLGAGVVAVSASGLVNVPTVAQAADAASTAKSTPRLWIDPKLAGLPARPWRKIHLDFHNSQHIKKLGEKFDADEWGDQLLAGNVDSVVIFAKDMHGYFYYPSKYGPVHPALTFDLLGAQVKACRQRKIACYAYYCTMWDNHLANTHPEWRTRKRDGSDYLPQPGRAPGFTAICMANKPLVDLEADHVREFVSRYELDGAWLDVAMPVAPDCYCAECLRQLRAQGKDPNDLEVQRAHKSALFIDFHRRMTPLIHETRPGCQVDYNDAGHVRIGDRVQHLDNIDIEALPTAGGWGYYYFPAQVRYSRTFGVTTYGVTGRFKASWADFGGLKLPAQLEVECASMVANGARCSIGDQLPPSGRLDPAVYHVIGQAYGRVKAIEPYLERAVPVVEAALMTPGVALARLRQDYTCGLLKLMMESFVQFDLVESDQPWERYGLVVLPDEFSVTPALAARLHDYVEKGGALIVCHNSGLLAGKKESWLERYGFSYAGPSPFKPAYMVPAAGFTGEIPPYEYALYEGASQWRVKSPATVLARLGEPLFNRSGEHYTSHAQSPFDHLTDYAAVACGSRVGLAGFPLGTSYYRQGYWVYRAAFQKLLSEVLPGKLVESSAPASTEITVTHQAASKELGRRERYLVHLVNYSPLRATPNHPSFHEEPIALTDVRVRLNLPLKNVTARTVYAGEKLRVRRVGGGLEVTVPRVPIHEIVNLELA